jgi:hypothetical protein
VSKGLKEKLQFELERLKRLLKMRYELKVVWLPNGNTNLSEKVNGETIYVCEENLDKAIKTLKHEFLDYAYFSNYRAL